MKNKYKNFENFLKSRGLQKASREEMKTMTRILVDDHYNSLNYGFLRKGNDNHLYVLIYTIKKNKNWEEPRIRLSMIRSTAWNGSMWNWNLCFTQMMGYKYDFKNEEKGTEKTITYTDSWKRNMSIMVNTSKWQDVLVSREPTLKYVPNLVENLLRYFNNDIAKGIKTFIKFPHQCEMLIKSGYTDYLTNTKMLSKPFKEIAKYIKYAEESGIAYSDTLCISWNMKQHKTPKNAYNHAQMALLQYTMNKLALNMSQAQEVIDYMTRQFKKRYNHSDIDKWIIDEYSSYLFTRTALGMDNQDHSARFPSDFEEAFSQLKTIKERIDNERRAREQAILKQKMAIAVEKAKETLESIPVVAQVKSKTYSLYHPTDETQFLALGNVMSNCVGRCGYYDKQTKGDCSIYAIKKNGEYYACLELVPSNNGAKIQQLYLKRNAQCDDETRLFIVTNLLPLFKNGVLKFEEDLTTKSVSC